MHRKYLIDLLENYHPSYATEIAAKANMLQFIKQNKNCFDRELEEGHITASAWLLNKNLDKVLLLHHAKLDIWCQLGGHCDGDPNILQVAIKEAQEESGIQNIVPISDQIFDIDVHKIPEYKGVPAHYHYDIRFLLKVADDSQPVKNTESKELKWFSKQISQLPTNADSIKRMFNKWIVMGSLYL